MDEYDDLETYNAEAEHDTWVDFDNYENTGTQGVFNGDNLDEFIDNINGWNQRFMNKSVLIAIISAIVIIIAAGDLYYYFYIDTVNNFWRSWI